MCYRASHDYNWTLHGDPRFLMVLIDEFIELATVS